MYCFCLTIMVCRYSVDRANLCTSILGFKCEYQHEENRTHNSASTLKLQFPSPGLLRVLCVDQIGLLSVVPKQAGISVR